MDKNAPAHKNGTSTPRIVAARISIVSENNFFIELTPRRMLHLALQRTQLLPQK
jgi:hypothetical protein